jgi:DNA mismatch repair ATPase MutL
MPASRFLATSEQGVQTGSMPTAGALNKAFAVMRHPGDWQRMQTSAHQADLISISDLPAAKALSSPHTPSKQQLTSGRVLRQVDKKFIPVVYKSELALVDQHAAGMEGDVLGR